ncbi:MAG TPA: RNA polymerase-binding protein DksA [Gammaproteobacteria bacterium]|nr:RNA polymerase-binding protein DksA [Gammaproteobacteria bacterium]
MVRQKTSDTNFLGVSKYDIKKDEEYMNLEHTDHFTHILNVWRQQLMEEVDRTVHHLQDESEENPADILDRAVQEEERSLELRTRDRERKLLSNVEKAINRLKDRSFGYCDNCDAEIGIRRLEARPTATKCIDCKTFDEIKEQRDQL